MAVESDYSILSTRGGAGVLTAARALLKDLEALLASEPDDRRDALLQIRREIAAFEADPYDVRRRRTLAARRLVAAWPQDDPIRRQIEDLVALMQRPLP